LTGSFTSHYFSKKRRPVIGFHASARLIRREIGFGGKGESGRRTDARFYMGGGLKNKRLFAGASISRSIFRPGRFIPAGCAGCPSSFPAPTRRGSSATFQGAGAKPILHTAWR